MQVSTVLGSLMVADPPAAGGPQASNIWAQAVGLCATDMTVYVGKVPDPLRPAARVLGRAWCGDMQAQDAVRAAETGDLMALARWQASLPDVSEIDASKLAQVHAMVGDQARGSVGRLHVIAQLLQQGRTQEAQQRVASGYSKVSGAGRPLVSVGALRAHTGASLTAAALDRPNGSVIEIP
jgi:hypothetical protein